jgi:hypothetical protein
MENNPKELSTLTDKNKSGEPISRSNFESDLDARLHRHAINMLPGFGEHWSIHSLVMLKRIALSRIIYYHELYKKIIDIPGVVCEFGVHWGATLSLLLNLRGIYEPYNISRKIYGFDTFEGFPVIDRKDGPMAEIGDFKTLKNYELVLDEILAIQEQFSPLNHIKKFELIKGDASVTINNWLSNNPHAVISMAIFDMDIYKPTRDVLEKIVPRLTKGSLLIFDELNCSFFPGETSALQEVLGLNNIRLHRFPHQSYCAWTVFGE